MNMGRTTVLIGAVVLLVIFYTLLPTIIDSIVTAQGATGISTAASNILDIAQLVVAAGGIAITGFVIFDEFRRKV